MLYPPQLAPERCTSMHFGENQLSPRSFGISPLPTAPLTVLQHGTVRASTPVSGRFTLAMGSSRGFGSCSTKRIPKDQTPCSDSLSLWHRPKRPSPPRGTNSPAHSSIGTPSPNRLGSDRSSAHGCRFSFTPLPGFFSPFPHGTLRYRSPRLFSLGTWSSQFPTRFLVSGGTHVAFPTACCFPLPGSHRLWRPLPGSFG